MRYAVVIENAGSNFSAYVPDLPGCVAYSAEDDRLFRRNVTGYSAGSALAGFSTLVGHDRSRFQGSSLGW